MDWIQAVLLALVQGLTEFLPISSSAHLILAPRFLGWADQGLAFDVAVHLGTLIAVIIYFRGEIGTILKSWLASLRTGSADSADARLGWQIVLATIPAGILGLLLHGFIDSYLRSPMVIASTTALFGVLLWRVDRRGGSGSDEFSLTYGQAFLIGLAQALALVPGTSRSGITITAGLALGLSRQAAARFSFLMAIPVIALASLLELWNLVQTPEPVQWGLLLLGVTVSALSAYLCIRLFLRALTHMGMLPFAIYRIILAGVIVAVFA